MATITIRKKELSSGKKSLYLDIVTDGKRTKEYLKLYLDPKKKSENQRMLFPF